MGTARTTKIEKKEIPKGKTNEFADKTPLIDKKGQDRLVLDNEGLAITIARRYLYVGRRFGLSFEDLKQECNRGFIIAAQKWDPSRGTKFGTYAGIWARKCILDAFNNTNPLHLPRNVRGKINALREALEVIKNEGNPSALTKNARKEYDEIMKGKETRESIEWRMEILEGRIIRATQKNISLDQPMREGGNLPHEFLIGSEETISDEIEQKNMREVLLKVIEKLSNMERIIIENRFLKMNPLTLKELGEMIGVSRERVRQKQNTALRKLEFELKKIKVEEKLLEYGILPEPKKKEMAPQLVKRTINHESEKQFSPLAEDVIVKKELRLLSRFKTDERKKTAYLESRGVPEEVIKNLDISQIELEKLIRFVSVAKKHNAFKYLKTNHILNNTTSAGFEGFIKWKKSFQDSA